MSEPVESEAEIVTVPTSPTLDTGDGDVVNTGASFSNAMTLELTDAEIQAAWRIIWGVRAKHQMKFIQKFNDASTFNLDDALKALEEMEDEIKTKLAEVDILASVDTVPILEGQPPAIEIIGMLPGSNLAKYGMDHERKEFEVKRATQRGEAFLGEHDG